MKLLILVALFFCLLSNVVSWNMGDAINLVDEEADPQAVLNRRQLAREYKAREQFRARVREEIAKEEIRHQYARDKIRQAINEFNDY